MKIFFSTTPRAKREYANEIKKIYELIRQHDHDLTDNIIEKIEEDEFYSWDDKQRSVYYKKTLKAIKEADICIFEASYASLGVGYLVAQALGFGKTVVVLHRHNKRPFMLDSANDNKVVLAEYTIDTLEEELINALEYAREKNDTRFNFFVTPRHAHYLDWVAKHKRLPRSVYLRNLIKKDMADNKEYQA